MGGITGRYYLPRETYIGDMAHSSLPGGYIMGEYGLSSLPGGYNKENMAHSSLLGCERCITVCTSCSHGWEEGVYNSVYLLLP